MVSLLNSMPLYTYDERLKMKRDTRQKSSLFLRKRTGFLSGISLHFRPFVVRYDFSALAFGSRTVFYIGI